MASNGDDIFNANRFGHIASWDGLGGTDTLFIDGRAENKFTYTQDEAGAIHVDSASGASHDYNFTLTNVEKVQIGNTVVDLTLLFPEDTEAPLVSLFSPSDEATGVAVNADIVITFNESISRGTGVITIKDQAGNTVESEGSTVSGSTLTINPTLDLSPTTNYTVELGSGTVLDAAGNSYAGTTSYNFTTAEAGSFSGTDGNDIFTNVTGGDVFDGGAGLDTINYSGESSAHTITKTDSGFTVTSTDGTDSLSNIERLHFSDKNIAFDIDSNAGQAYRIYKAAFDRIPDNGGLGFWINELDNGATLLNVAAGFTGSNEFVTLYGENNSNDDFLTSLYFNVLDRDGDEGGRAFWLGHLNAGTVSREQLLIDFSESTENQANVIELIANGIEYAPFV